MSKMKLQQWQHYNPLDKSTNAKKSKKSNKLPYAKDEVSKEVLVKPQVTSVGVLPIRKSSEVKTLDVMLVGDPIRNNEKSEIAMLEKTAENECSVHPVFENKVVKGERKKMPAIVNTEGTAMPASFVARSKPSGMPRSNIKLKKKSLALPNHANINAGKSPTQISDTSGQKRHEIVVCEASSTPEPEEQVPPVRSIDDMIQTLRSSRHASGTQKSMSDMKIDEILQQVMSHAKQWIDESKQPKLDAYPETEDKETDFIQVVQETNVPEEPTAEHEITIEVDISDTVSTLASQISAPAGIPDVATILMRKSSHAMHGTSSLSETSSPTAMIQDDDDSVDYNQALQDLNLSLDVKNDDILHVQGGCPAVMEIPAKPMLNDKDQSRTPRSEKNRLPSFVNKNKIHRLCILPSFRELEVGPQEFALSACLHSARHMNTFESSDTKHTLGHLSQHIHLQDRVEETLRKQPHICRNTERETEEIYMSQAPPVVDSSKLDPLDIDGWRRLVEGEFEKKDYSIHGLKCSPNDGGMWRLMWTIAPPKMGLTASAVKALVFPKYHGTKLPKEAEPEEENWELDDGLSDIVVEIEQKTTFNPRTLLRRHKSVELSSTHLNTRKLYRSQSTPNIRYPSFAGGQVENLVQTDYTAGLAEVKQQKDLVYQQHLREQHVAQMIRSQTPDTPGYAVQQEQGKNDDRLQLLVNKSSSMLEPRENLSLTLAAEAREAGRSYVSFPRKKSRQKRGKRYVQNVRKVLTSYQPLSLSRSMSIGSFQIFDRSRNKSKRELRRETLPKKITRSTSVPRVMDFNWLISQHQVYPEKIDDLREWVRDIWNTWFDQVFPPNSDDDSECSEEDFVISEVGDTANEKRDASQSRSDTRKIPIPDIIPSAISIQSDPDDAKETSEAEELIRQELNSLTCEIDALPEHETSRRACHLSRRGALLRKLGKIKRALDDLNKAIELEPRLASAYWQRHLIHLLKNQLHDALDDLNVFIKINRFDKNGYRSRADIFAALGDYTMAIVNYSQTIKLDPNDEKPYFQRACIFEKTGDLLLAMEDYAAVVRLNPARTDALAKRAIYHFDRRSWHVAILEFTQLIQKEPINAKARTYRGRAYAEVGQHESALSDLSAAIHLNPLAASAFYYRGALIRTAAPKKALQDLSISLMLDDSEKNVLALLHRGILYSEMHKYQDALSDFEQTLRLDHSLACAQVNIGLIHLQVTGNFWEAVRRFSAAIKGDPTYIRSYVCRADALARTHDYRAALRDITRAIHLHPTERHLYLRRGKLLLELRELKLAAYCVRHIATLDKSIVSTSATQQAVVQSFLGNHTAAVDSLSAACRTKPVPHMYVLLSKALMKGKRFQEAITNLKNALELSALFAYGDTSMQNREAPPETAEAHFLLGQCYTEMTDHKQALASYNQALKVNFKYAEAYYHRGLCRLKLDQTKGVQDLNRALALQPTLFEAYLSRAAFYSTKQRYSKAILNCNEALRLRPESVRALLCRGALKYYISAYHHAIADLTQAIKLDKQCSLAYYNRAVCLHKMKKHDAALKDYSIILILTSNDDSVASKSLRLRVFVNRALLYLNSEFQDAKNAALDLREASILSPGDTSIIHTMALCYHKLRDLREAEAAYNRCIEVDPYFLAAYIGRGDAFCDAGNLDEARAEYQKALRLDPACVEARVHLGYALQMGGLLQLAWMQFTSALSLDASCQSALEGRAVTCLHAGNLDAATRDVALALSSGPPTARILTACGVVNQCKNDLHTAMAFYNKARILNPSYTPAHFNATVLYMRDRRFAEARDCLEIVIDQNPNDDAAYLNRAIANVFLGNSNAALEDFEKAIELDPRNAHVYYNRGNLYYVLKQYQDAERDFNTALGIDPSDYTSLKRRADVRGQLGRKEEAINDYRESLIIHEKALTLRSLGVVAVRG